MCNSFCDWMKVPFNECIHGTVFVAYFTYGDRNRHNVSVEILSSLAYGMFEELNYHFVDG